MSKVRDGNGGGDDGVLTATDLQRLEYYEGLLQRDAVGCCCSLPFYNFQSAIGLTDPSRNTPSALGST